MSDTPKSYRFTCTGSMDLAPDLQVARHYRGAPTAFRLPDGRVIDLAICLRVTGDNDVREVFVASEADMQALGVCLTEYDALQFDEADE